jgi:hypothetical protein
MAATIGRGGGAKTIPESWQGRAACGRGHWTADGHDQLLRRAERSLRESIEAREISRAGQVYGSEKLKTPYPRLENLCRSTHIKTSSVFVASEPNAEQNQAIPTER